MKKKIQLLAFLFLIISACHEDVHGPLVKGDNKPGVITNVKVENIPGGAKVSYAVPADGDLLYVQAVYSAKDGEESFVKSSLYKNFVQIEGFADTAEHEIKLYAVNKGENRSDPIVIKIQPLISPLQLIYNSLQVKEDFGGVNIRFKNDLGKEFVINTLVKNENGGWDRLDKLYTLAKSRDYSVRGLADVEREFAFYITDSYMNVSDTLFKKLTPLYEEMLDKKLWKRGNLLSDFYRPVYPVGTANPREVENLWDNLHGQYNYYFQAADAPPLPSWFTIDLGKTMRLSRMLTQQYEGTAEYMYALGNPREYEIWGSNELEDDFSHWTKLLDCTSIKPSGLPLGLRSAEDIEYAKAGENYAFPLDAKPVRYIRFVLKKTWANTNSLLLDELTLWGQTPN